MNIGPLALRCTVGALFVGHGTQKLFGWFGGHGIEGTGGFFESLGLRPGKQNAMAAGAAETAGGALLALGALTPVATSLISSTMITAARTAHAGKGPWVTSGGWEYNAVLVAAMTALAERGPGRPSVDARLFPQMKGRTWAALSFAAAIAGSHLATSGRLGEAVAAAESAKPEPVAAEAAPEAASRDEADGRFTRPEQIVSDELTPGTTQPA